MRTRISLALFVAAIAVLVLPLSAWQAQSAAQSPPPSTGLILGRVVDGDGDTPIAGAIVSLLSPAMAPTPGNPAPTLPRVVTGPDGFFVFRNLRKGEYRFSATIGGYLSGGAGMNRADGSPLSVSLGDGEKLNDVVVRLWKGSAVTGRVVDEVGDALEGMTMQLLKVDRFGARRRFTALQPTVSDDRGMYRIPGISPGEYVVCALFNRHVVPLAASVAQASGGQEMQRLISGSGAGSVSGSGYRVGDYILISASGQRNVDPAPDELGRMSVFADACHPASPTVSGADPIVLRSGEERWVNLSVRTVPALRITGTVSGPSGPIGAGLGIHLYAAAGEDASIDSGIEAANTVTAPDGTFGFVGVAPGSYVVRATYSPRPAFDYPPELLAQAEAAGVFLSRPPTPQQANEPTLWASQAVSVGNADVAGVPLVLREAPRVTGRLAFEGTAKRPEGDPLTRIGITFEPAGGQLLERFAVPRGSVAADATFQAAGAIPGAYLIRATALPAEWRLKSVVVNGIDAAADPIEVGTSNLTNVVVTFTDHPSELSGVVQDQKGRPDQAASVIVFPVDRRYWLQYGASSSRSANVRTSKSGGFTVANLPAGEYFIIAVDDRVGVRWQDPGTLASLSAAATRVTLGDGEKRTQNLTTRSR